MGYLSLRTERRRVAAVAEALVSWVLGLALIASAIAHCGHPYAFLGAVYGYGLLGSETGLYVAMVLPMLQLLVATCLLSGLWEDAAHGIALAMLSCFAVAQTVAWMRRLDISCGCFDAGVESKIGPMSLGIVYSLWLLSVSRHVLRLNAVRHSGRSPKV